MITIRPYTPQDAPQVGILIADTFGTFNLDYATPEERERLLGPFRHAHSDNPAHRQAIVEVLAASMIFVAEDAGKIVGVLRGRPDRLQSLFVDETWHRQGIGRRLVERFEEACRHQGATEIQCAATLYAVPFYLRMGYEKTGEVETGPCFDGDHFMWQPMRKVLS